MIEKNIVFITGAGASIDFGFPTGESLVNQLLNESFVNTNDKFLGVDIDQDFFRDFNLKLKYSNTPSIDIFIANNPEYAELSKALIAKIIAAAEKKSFEKLFDKNWLKYLWTKMIEGCMDFDKFKENNVKFITFNYDRTLEYFLAISTKSFFNISMPSIDIYNQLFESIPIIHVFGKIGNTPWENQTMHRTYDANPGEYKTWKSVGQELKTIYESKKSSSQIKILDALNEADEIYFLGFGYNSFNLELLGINQIDMNKYISGSRYKMSNSEIEDINYLNNDKFRKLTIHDSYDCYDFLKNEIFYFAKNTTMR